MGSVNTFAWTLQILGTYQILGCMKSHAAGAKQMSGCGSR